VLSIVGVSLGLVVLAISSHVTELWAGIVIFGLSLGIFTPSITSLVSFQSDASSRGAVMGAYQASSSAGRIVGPALSGPVYFALGHAAPYVLSAILAALGALLLSRIPGRAALK